MKLSNHLLFAIGYFCLFWFSCTHKTQPEEVILAQVGTHNIVVDEFIRRSEYTIRPPYCRGDGNLEKKIILNSLIAEKMLALEAGEQNDMIKNEHFQRYIQGRKEQVMREELFRNEIYRKIHLTPDKVRSAYGTAGRKYRIQYFSVQNIETAEKISEWLQQGRSFEDIFYQFVGNDTIPMRVVQYQSQEPAIIHDALFSDTLRTKQVIGPLRVEDDMFITMKIKGWTESLALSERDITQRTNDVRDYLTLKEADKMYFTFAGRLMKGKRMNFSREMLESLAMVLAPVYLGSDEEKKELFLQQVLNKKGDLAQSPISTTGDFFSKNANQPLCKTDDKTWTVADFEREIEKHPLVFRKQKMRNSEFGEQLKLAIADLVRDHYITQEAYKEGLDRAATVQRTEMMWQDALLALYTRDEYLKNLTPSKDDSAIIMTKYLNPWIDELQKKYSNEIFVNVKEFDRIKLTRIDMFATQKNVPFPIIVPSFPQITNDPWLNYGNKIPE